MSEQFRGDNLLSKISGRQWQKIGVHKRSGVLTPLFSVYSRQSAGLGDIGDLRLLIDWCQKTGNSILQLLPMNEMGSTFCPYDAISSFALEPLYLSLAFFSAEDQAFCSQGLAQLKKKFPCGSQHVDYGLKEEKLGLFHKIFQRQEAQPADSFGQYIAGQEYWLNDFALFKVLKDYHNGLPWYEWGDEFKHRDGAALGSFRKAHEAQMRFQMWLQWQLNLQMKQVKEYAVKRKVLIKGDLPILVSRDSADVWAHQDYFKLDFASGAPPDMYCAKGQRWGMPPYNWERIARDGYVYARQKLVYAENFYDLLRIDHVVGLFRLWSIPYHDPTENQGLHGLFDPPEEDKWGPQGRELLTMMIQGTSMLLCAEDLGTIPPVCKVTLEELGIPGNDVQRWIKDWNTRHDFLAPAEYRFLSVAMLSTHDTTNWAAWWENEAGTIDEMLFLRKCLQRGIEYNHVKDALFDLARSRHARLRWLKSVNSAGALASILGRPAREIGDFVELYVNSFEEKEKLWKLLGNRGPMRERADTESIHRAFKFNLKANAIFTVNLIIDWLSIAGIFTGDPHQYRINRPGTTSHLNWSLTIPISLDDLLKHPVCADIKGMVASSGRIIT